MRLLRGRGGTSGSLSAPAAAAACARTGRGGTGGVDVVADILGKRMLKRQDLETTTVSVLCSIVLDD